MSGLVIDLSGCVCRGLHFCNFGERYSAFGHVQNHMPFHFAIWAASALSSPQTEHTEYSYIKGVLNPVCMARCIHVRLRMCRDRQLPSAQLLLSLLCGWILDHWTRHKTFAKETSSWYHGWGHDYWLPQILKWSTYRKKNASGWNK